MSGRKKLRARGIRAPDCRVRYEEMLKMAEKQSSEIESLRALLQFAHMLMLSSITSSTGTKLDLDGAIISDQAQVRLKHSILVCNLGIISL